MTLLKKSPYYVVFGGAVTVFITLGLNHSNGLFLLPITNELNSGRELFSLAGALGILFSGIGAPIFGGFSDKYGAGRTIFVLGILQILSWIWVGNINSEFEEAKKHLDLIYCEMDPGDVLFFHCNTLHRSDKNKSNDRRWTLLCCYNSAKNDPFIDHHHPRYTRLKKVPDEEIKKAGDRFLDADLTGAFLSRPSAPPTLQTKSGKLFSN